MLIYQTLGLLALMALLYSATSGWFERRPVNGALVFMAFGILFGNTGLGWIDVDIGTEGLRIIAEVTLGVVLFCDAAEADFGVLERNLRLPERLLSLALPLTIGLGFVVAVWLFDEFSYLEAAILAAMLAPTDAALGKAVVANESVPAPIRTSLNVESGLNDGICVPVLLALLALVESHQVEASLLTFFVTEIGIGLAVGLPVAYLSCKLLALASGYGLIHGPWWQLPVVSIALLAFAAAQLLGGSGFIAAFSGGLLFGRMIGSHKRRMLESAEASGDTLSMITWVIIGAAMVGPALGSFSWQVVLYALLSLTMIRMLPVLLALSGTALSLPEKLFMGWFGPRGLASIVFIVVVADSSLPAVETLTLTVILTVMLSVVAHGMSANPIVNSLFGNATIATVRPNHKGARAAPEE